MENLNSQFESIIKKHVDTAVAAAVVEVTELQRLHIANALGVNGTANGASHGGSNGHSNGKSASTGEVSTKSTKLAAKKPVTAKVAKTAKKKSDAEVNKSKGIKRDPALLESLQQEILEYVSANCQKTDEKGNKGVNIETLSKALGKVSKDLTLPMKKLIKDKKITTTGQKRATRYFAK